MTPQRPTLRLRTAADVLAAVPYGLGFHPRDSLVLLTIGKAAHRLHARVDLPHGPAEQAELVGYLVAVCRRNALATVAVVVYADEPAASAPTSDEPAGVKGVGPDPDATGMAMVAALTEARVEVPLALRADGARWWRLGRRAATATPYDVSSHPLAARAVVEGRVIWASRDELREQLVGTEPEQAWAVAEAARACSPERLGGGTVVDHLRGEGRWVQSRVREHLADRRRLSPPDAVRMLAALVSVEVRDVAWAEMTHRNAVGHVDLWRDLLRRAPEELAAAPAALLGFAAWLSGDGALAWCAVERCLAADPDYGLAGLLTQALAGAVPPSVWRPFDRDKLGLFAE